jgi:hypothetical protein
MTVTSPDVHSRRKSALRSGAVSAKSLRASGLQAFDASTDDTNSVVQPVFSTLPEF